MISRCQNVSARRSSAAFKWQPLRWLVVNRQPLRWLLGSLLVFSLLSVPQASHASADYYWRFQSRPLEKATWSTLSRAVRRVAALHQRKEWTQIEGDASLQVLLTPKAIVGLHERLSELTLTQRAAMNGNGRAPTNQKSTLRRIATEKKAVSIALFFALRNTPLVADRPARLYDQLKAELARFNQLTEGKKPLLAGAIDSLNRQTEARLAYRVTNKRDFDDPSRHRTAFSFQHGFLASRGDWTENDNAFDYGQVCWGEGGYFPPGFNYRGPGHRFERFRDFPDAKQSELHMRLARMGERLLRASNDIHHSWRRWEEQVLREDSEQPITLAELTAGFHIGKTFGYPVYFWPFVYAKAAVDKLRIAANITRLIMERVRLGEGADPNDAEIQEACRIAQRDALGPLPELDHPIRSPIVRSIASDIANALGPFSVLEGEFRHRAHLPVSAYDEKGGTLLAAALTELGFWVSDHKITDVDLREAVRRGQRAGGIALPSKEPLDGPIAQGLSWDSGKLYPATAFRPDAPIHSLNDYRGVRTGISIGPSLAEAWSRERSWSYNSQLVLATDPRTREVIPAIKRVTQQPSGRIEINWERASQDKPILFARFFLEKQLETGALDPFKRSQPADEQRTAVVLLAPTANPVLANLVTRFAADNKLNLVVLPIPRDQPIDRGWVKRAKSGLFGAELERALSERHLDSHRVSFLFAADHDLSSNRIRISGDHERDEAFVGATIAMLADTMTQNERWLCDYLDQTYQQYGFSEGAAPLPGHMQPDITFRIPPKTPSDGFGDAMDALRTANGLKQRFPKLNVDIRFSKQGNYRRMMRLFTGWSKDRPFNVFPEWRNTLPLDHLSEVRLWGPGQSPASRADVDVHILPADFEPPPPGTAPINVYVEEMGSTSAVRLPPGVERDRVVRDSEGRIHAVLKTGIGEGMSGPRLDQSMINRLDHVTKETVARIWNLRKTEERRYRRIPVDPKEPWGFTYYHRNSSRAMLGPNGFYGDLELAFERHGDQLYPQATVWDFSDQITPRRDVAYYGTLPYSQAFTHVFLSPRRHRPSKIVLGKRYPDVKVVHVGPDDRELFFSHIQTADLQPVLGTGSNSQEEQMSLFKLRAFQQPPWKRELAEQYMNVARDRLSTEDAERVCALVNRYPCKEVPRPDPKPGAEPTGGHYQSGGKVIEEVLVERADEAHYRNHMVQAFVDPAYGAAYAKYDNLMFKELPTIDQTLIDQIHVLLQMR